MSERKNIDRLFQEKFKDFEAEPSEQSWKNIEARLQKKRKRRIIPIWFRLSGIAAALILGLFVTNRLVDYRNNVENEVVVTPDTGLDGSEESNPQQNSVHVVTAGKEDGKNSGKNDSVEDDPGNIIHYPSKSLVTTKRNQQRGANEDNGHSNENVADISDEQVPAKKAGKAQKREKGRAKILSTIANTDKETGISNKSETSIAANNRIHSSDNRIKGITKSAEDLPDNIENKVTEVKTQTQTIAVAQKPADDNLKIDTTAVATVVPNALGELLNEKENKSVTEIGQKINRWQVYTHIAPIYLSSTSDGSAIDPNLSTNAKEYKTSLSYGAGVSYAISKKLSMRAGINSVSLEYNTNDITFSQSPSTRQLQHVDNNISGAMLNIESNSTPPPAAGLVNVSSQKFNGSINQKTGYIEVPLELSYKIIDKKFGVDLVGGFSTLFLQQNEISLLSDGGEIEIGQANNLNSTHFSGNFGVGLKYDILKALQFNVEPMIKYQINTYNSGDFKPFFFGLYTGLNYRF